MGEGMSQPVGYDLQTAPVVKVNGSELSSKRIDQLTGVRVTRTFRLAARAVLRFEDWDYEIASSAIAKVGADVEISSKKTGILFQGQITGIELLADAAVPTLVLTADDPAHKLTQERRVRTFTEVSYSDVVKKMAMEVGLQAKVTATTERFEYLIQADTDYGFLCEMADRVGFDWWVEGKTLNFAPPKPDAAPAVSLTLGRDLGQFGVRATALHPQKASVTGWDPKAKKSIVGSANLPSGSLPDLVRPYLTQGSAKTASSVGSPVSTGEATELAKRETAGWVSSALTATGSTIGVTGELVPGSVVAIVDAGPVSGNYPVTEVEHSYSRNGFRTRFVAGERRPVGLVDRLGPDPRSSFRMSGLVVGVVTGVSNPKGSQAEVKVKFPGVDDTLESAWARLVTLGGGSKRGVLFVPEINDEVIVGFEAGDLRRPVVLGGLFNGKDASPTFKKQGSAVDTRAITSRLGHVVEFGDGNAPDDQYIGLSLAGGHHQVKLGKKELTATVPTGTPIKLSAGQTSITIGDDGSITLSGKKITLKADTDIELSGLNVTAKANVKFSAGGAMAEIKANGQAEVSASGPVMIKGAIVQVN